MRLKHVARVFALTQTVHQVRRRAQDKAGEFKPGDIAALVWGFGALEQPLEPILLGYLQVSASVL